ncbi:MAG: corrinoid protein-associated methyltransferase CpaM [Nitrospinota bacterium]
MVFSYVFMKILETRPRSYDRRMDKASRGKVKEIKRSVAAQVPPGSHTLEIGCGTGELAAMLVARGCTVDGFDSSPSMVEASLERIKSESLQESFTVRKMGVDAMDRLPDSRYDAVVSTLTFSELSDDERRYALENAYRVLQPGGLIIIADEVRPRSRAGRFLHALIRMPVVTLTYLISGATTAPIENLCSELANAGFSVEKEERTHGDSFAIISAHKLMEQNKQ